MSSWEQVVNAQREQNKVLLAKLQLKRDKEEEEPWELCIVSHEEASAITSEELRARYFLERPVLLKAKLQNSDQKQPAQPDGWQLLADVVGNKRVAVHHHSIVSDAPSELMLVKDLVRAIRAGNQNDDDDDDEHCCDLYMYDVSVRQHLNALLEYWSVPACVQDHDYLLRTRRKHPFTGWPTLFVGARGTESKTHVDRWQGAFWMTQMEGRKTWTIFHPDDTPLLRPQWTSNKFDPSFPDIRNLLPEEEEEEEEEKNETMKTAARYVRVTLTPGDTLLVPGGAVHAVHNDTDSIALAGNFVDSTNLERVLEALRLQKEHRPELAMLYDALVEVDFE